MSQAWEKYEQWLTNPALDEQSRAELLALQADRQELEDRFYQELQFGTAGLRGVLGAGSNRMNYYTVARAAAGFAQYFLSRGADFCAQGLVVSYDSRHYSPEFAHLTARIFVSRGIKVYLVDELRPVPLLSFAIRHFSAAGGVMITASHNPREYNGFKAYGSDGGQLAPEAAAVVAAAMDNLGDYIGLYRSLASATDLESSPLWQSIGEELDAAYMAMLDSLSLNKAAVARHADLAIVYAPLHGSGNKPVRRILAQLGFNNVTVVPEQELPDGDFPTCPYPNPESRAALKLGIDLAEKLQADLLIATDPDADRTGLAVRSNTGEFVVLSGNEIGILLMDYILSAHQAHNTLPAKGFCVSTIVSSRLSKRICAYYGVALHTVLTGFKFIAEQIYQRDELGTETFLFGYEESFGYLAGTDVRDKDAVVASMLLAEMAADSADKGETIYERLQRIFATHGFAAEQTISLVSPGKVGLEKIAAVMRGIRAVKQSYFPGVKALRINDYLTASSLEVASGLSSPLEGERSNVLVYELPAEAWFAVRPSGTEPKLKIYFGCYCATAAAAQTELAALQAKVVGKIEEALKQ